MVIIPVQTLAMAVTDPSDITVEATPAEVVLAPGRIDPDRSDRHPKRAL